MTRDILDKGAVLQDEIDRLQTFISYCKDYRHINFFKKKNFVVEVSDYMREIKIFELSPRLRQKFIVMLEQELEELQEEFSKLE